MQSSANVLRRRTGCAEECDVVYNGHIYCYLNRAGARAFWKRRMRRRERHDCGFRTEDQ